MKSLLAALTLLVAASALPTVASSQEAGFFDAPAYSHARDGGWGPRGGWDDRDRFDDRDDDVLSERQIVRQLMRQGFVQIRDIERRRNRYIVQAVRPNGALIRLAVDAYDGEVIARQRIGWVTEGRDPERDLRRPTNGIEFDLGGGVIGLYAR